MAITRDDFNKIWASTSPLTPYRFSESQYKEGWNFIGSTPPSRQMWDFLQKNNDEKMQYLLNNFDNYLPLSGGTLTGVVNGVTPTAGDNSTKIATTEFVNAKASVGTPTGVVQAFAGRTTPQGWLLCDGSAVSRTDYAALYAVIGTTYGAGNGSTTFNLPNLVDKFVEGSATAGTVKSAGLPNITGTANVRSGKDANNNILASRKDGAITCTIQDSSYTWRAHINTEDGTPNKLDTLIFNASNSNSIYGSSNTVQPPALTMRYIIKY